MKLLHALSTLGKSAAHRCGSSAAGRGLVSDLGSDDETVRMLAGMFLVRNGERSLQVLREAMARRKDLPTVLTVLADLSLPECEELIRPYVDDADPGVRVAARAAVDTLDRNRRAVP